MNELPNEIWLKIFNEVDPIEQIVLCRLVCKKWNRIVNNLRLKVLVISSSSNLPNSKWWCTYNPISCRHMLKNDQSLGSILLKLSQPLFNSLRSLHIYSISDKTLLTGFLNRFKQLEQLEVIYSQLRDIGCVLNLENLRILNIGDAINDAIVLNTPRLERIKINLAHFDKVTFTYPESIRFCEFLRYNDHIKSFINLEYLYVKNINVLDDDFLLHLKQLKEIHFDGRKEIFYTLKHQKKAYRRNDLKLFYFGVHLEDNIPSYDLKNSRHQINKKAIELFGDNYQQLASILPFVHQIDYCDLESYFDDKIPRCFIRRFVNLDYLIVTGKVKYANQLAQILSDCLNLKSLAIDSSLDQQFYTNLPAILPCLEYLIIKNEQKPNFNQFLLNFNNLELIYIRHSLSVDFVRRIFDKYRYLIFSFIYHSKNVTIRSLRNNEYRLEIINQQNTNFNNLDDLFNHLSFNLNF